jgi:hypothetical protein
MRVIAMAYKGRPLDRAVVSETASLAYVSQISDPSSTEVAANDGVGFPKKFVFRFDAALFESLERAWTAGDTESLGALWERARPIDAP